MSVMTWTVCRSQLCMFLLGSSALLTFQVPGATASEYCSAYWDEFDDYSGDNYHEGFWCDQDCCGSRQDQYCCDYDDYTNVAGAVIGGIISLVVVGVVICLVICCCVAACPLYQRRSRGTVLGWGQGQTVTTTTVPVITTTQMQPVPYGGNQLLQTGVIAAPGAPYGQPPPYGQPVAYGQPAPYPQPTAYPASQASYPPPQYPGPQAAGPPLQNPPPPSAPASVIGSENVYEKLQ